jgi:hypothetical protein
MVKVIHIQRWLENVTGNGTCNREYKKGDLPDHPASCTHKHSGTPLQQTDIKHDMSETEFWSHNLKKWGPLEDPGIDRKIISKWTTI